MSSRMTDTLRACIGREMSYTAPEPLAPSMAFERFPFFGAPV